MQRFGKHMNSVKDASKNKIIINISKRNSDRPFIILLYNLDILNFYLVLNNVMVNLNFIFHD